MMAVFAAAGCSNDSFRQDLAEKSWRRVWIEKYGLADDAPASRIASALHLSPKERIF
jgi:hypothetical protein